MLKVGKVKEAHGIKGELYILIFSKELLWLNKIKEVHLQDPKTHKTQSFSIERARPHKSGFILQTSMIKDRTQAEGFKGWEFYLPKDLFTTEGNDDFYLCEVEGFKVIEQGLGEVGTVVGFVSNASQDLIRLKSQENLEFLIPLVDDFITQVDRSKKILHMSLPPGLLEPEYAI